MEAPKSNSRDTMTALTTLSSGAGTSNQKQNITRGMKQSARECNSRDERSRSRYVNFFSSSQKQ